MGVEEGRRGNRSGPPAAVALAASVASRTSPPPPRVAPQGRQPDGPKLDAPGASPLLGERDGVRGRRRPPPPRWRSPSARSPSVVEPPPRHPERRRGTSADLAGKRRLPQPATPSRPVVPACAGTTLGGGGRSPWTSPLVSADLAPCSAEILRLADSLRTTRRGGGARTGPTARLALHPGGRHLDPPDPPQPVTIGASPAYSSEVASRSMTAATSARETLWPGPIEK